VIGGDIRLYPVLGAVLLFFGVVVALRVMIMALRNL
jgi:nitrogen fixation protein FixH